MTIFAKNVSMGIDFAWTPSRPGLRISSPPRHLSAGVTGVSPHSSRMMRRSMRSRSLSTTGSDTFSILKGPETASEVEEVSGPFPL